MTRLNDSLDNLFNGDTGPVRTSARTDFRSAEQTFTEGCPKCHGTGQTRWGVCFKCNGAGKRTFKTSPQARAQGRVNAAERRADTRAAAVTEWSEANPAEAAWIIAKEATFGFAASMRDSLLKYGSLTDNQTAAIRRCIEQDAARAAAAQERVANAPVADTAGVDRLKAAFDHAIEYSRQKGRKLASPRITIGGVVISPAKATSANAGALYVKEGQTYLGKIAAGKFITSRECTDEQRGKVLAFVADPIAAAEAYGKEYNTCCVCNRTLTAEESMSRFIGPICAEKMGW